jgi:hypothetical protein
VNGLAASDFFIGGGSKSSLRYNSRGYERRDPDIVCRLIVRLMPNAERPECLARKAKPVEPNQLLILTKTPVSGEWRRKTPFTACSTCLMKSGASSNSRVIFILLSKCNVGRLR